MLADFEIALIDHRGDDVGAVLQLEGDEVGLAVLQLVDGELLRGRRLDVGEFVVVIDRGDIEGAFVVEGVIELQCLGRVVGAELLDGVGGVGLGELRLRMRRQPLREAGTSCVAPLAAAREDGSDGSMTTFRSGSAVSIIVQREGVDVAFIGNQVEVGVDAFLRRMQKAVVATASMIQKSLSPVATSRIFSVGGNWISVV